MTLIKSKLYWQTFRDHFIRPIILRYSISFYQKLLANGFIMDKRYCYPAGSHPVGSLTLRLPTKTPLYFLVRLSLTFLPHFIIIIIKSPTVTPTSSIFCYFSFSRYPMMHPGLISLVLLTKRLPIFNGGGFFMPKDIIFLHIWTQVLANKWLKEEILIRQVSQYGWNPAASILPHRSLLLFHVYLLPLLE
jgi:hypothetical protein